MQCENIILKNEIKFLTKSQFNCQNYTFSKKHSLLETFLHFQIAIFLETQFQTIHIMRFGLISHYLSTKSQCQTHIIYY
jgi:hypothetical protein